jgi:hypothetical protein
MTVKKNETSNINEVSITTKKVCTGRFINKNITLIIL